MQSSLNKSSDLTAEVRLWPSVERHPDGAKLENCLLLKSKIKNKSQQKRNQTLPHEAQTEFPFASRNRQRWKECGGAPSAFGGAREEPPGQKTPPPSLRKLRFPFQTSGSELPFRFLGEAAPGKLPFSLSLQYRLQNKRKEGFPLPSSKQTKGRWGLWGRPTTLLSGQETAGPKERQIMGKVGVL